MYIKVLGKDNVKKGIIAISHYLMENVDEICSNLDDVNSITIHAELAPNEVCNFDITKNHIANFKEEENNE